LISRKEINEQKEMGRRKTKRRQYVNIPTEDGDAASQSQQQQQEGQEQEHQTKLPRERRRYINLPDDSSV